MAELSHFTARFRIVTPQKNGELNDGSLDFQDASSAIHQMSLARGLTTKLHDVKADLILLISDHNRQGHLRGRAGGITVEIDTEDPELAESNQNVGALS